MSEPRILLVDDEFSGTQVLALMLVEEGYHVTVAPDGRQALAKLEEAAPDLLITDFMMPVMNGAELIQAVRASGRRSFPVLLISGVPEAALKTYGMGYDAFLRKPFGLDLFLSTVRRLVDAAGPQPEGPQP